tara:strand:- start:332 stop:1006 length:675 start_codon:yes stop_codon:yes gene_type:complete
MFKVFIILLFGSTSVLMCQNNFNAKGEKHGAWLGYHANGNVKYTGFFVNDKEVGDFIYYDYNGNVLIELNYIDTGQTSHAVVYDAGGAIKSKGLYVNKQKNGLWTYYNLSGQKISEENYINGLLHGLSVYYHSSGLVSEKYHYINGLKDGRCDIFYPSGSLNMTGFYSKDKLHGVSEFYYDLTKQVEAKGKYFMGLKDSIWLFYNQSGDILDSVDYRNLNFNTE